MNRSFCMIFLSINTIFSMKYEAIKIIQTKKIKSAVGVVPNFYESKVYSADSQDEFSRYINEKSIYDPKLKDFLEENKDYKILLVGPSSWMNIDFSLIGNEDNDCCTIL